MILEMAVAVALAAQNNCVELPAGVDLKTAEAQGDAWFVSGDPILYKKRTYSKYGLPRVLTPFEVERNGAFQGALVFLEKGVTDPEVIYVLVNHRECAFQPYQLGA